MFLQRIRMIWIVLVLQRRRSVQENDCLAKSLDYPYGQNSCKEERIFLLQMSQIIREYSLLQGRRSSITSR